MNGLRRRILKHSAAALGAAATLGLPILTRGADAMSQSTLDLHIELQAMPDQIALRPGPATRVWRYHAKVLRGAQSALEMSPGQFPGPIIRVKHGQRVRIELLNGLPEETIIHWHGLHVPEAMDGHPRFAIAPGARYVYEFTVVNRAGSYWFHPHPHGRTGKQVYAGLAGLLLVSDDEEAALALPVGPYDIPLVVQDRNFDKDNQFVYLDGAIIRPDPRKGGMMGAGMMNGRTDRGMMGGGMGSMMAGMMGVLGNEILVNGRAQAQRDVERRPYRLRLLNASNTRIYKLAWSDRSPLTVIGTDGGLLASPLQRDYVMLAPAERIDLWVDFGHWQPGTQMILQSLAFEGGMDMGGMMSGSNALRDGAPFPMQRFRVRAGAVAGNPLPRQLSSVPLPEPRSAVNFDRPKVFELTMGMMAWGINGAGFDMLAASALETVRLGTQEIWEFRNDGQGAMMGMVMPHSMHVHGLQFRVIARSVSEKFARAHATVNAGFVDEGWKDTVLVMPGERVRILLRFADYPGLFLYHCHMLEHEDSGLMRNYRVEA